MQATTFIVMAGVFMALMFIYKFSDRWIKKISRKTARTINWTGFTVATFSGIAWYIFNDSIFMLIMVAGIVTYFLFFSPERHSEKEETPV